jgi:hypothetical protein
MKIKRILVSLAAAATLTHVLPAAAQNPCAWSRDLRLVNGKIHTMDANDSVVSEVTIQEGRIAYVGRAPRRKLNPCTKVVDLHGRTVVPGLIDNHNHFALFSRRPGYDVMVETATSIPQAMAMLKRRAQSVPAGAWITAIGDWTPRLFAEKRPPTLAELDEAVPEHPVLFASFGPAVTNSLGRKFFASKGVTVGSDGVLKGAAATAALNVLRDMQTPEDRIRSAKYAQSYALQYGLTTSVDMGVFASPGSPDLQDDATLPGIASANPWTAYDQIYALDRRHELDERVRLFLLSMDKDKTLPMLRQRLRTLHPHFGDDMLRVAGIGEFVTPWIFAYDWKAGQHPDNYEAALKLVAEHGWPYQQHTLSLAEVQFTAKTYEKVNAVTPIADLHWSIAHVPSIDPATLETMKRIGVGMALHGWKYLQGREGTPAGQPAGPPYRTILDSGIHAGAGSDAGDIAMLDPWYDIYYMVTGKDCTGALINAGEQVTREQALRMYTADNGWFFRESKDLGSIETGKLGDVVVLDKDYFDAKQVSDEDIKQIRSVLTVVGGRIVHDTLR